MRSKVVLTGLLLLLVFTSFSFKCDGGPPADNSPFRPAAKAAGDIAEGIKAMITIKRALAKSGTLKPAEERPLTDAMLRLTRADKAFLREVNAVKSAADASASKPKLCLAFAALNAAMTEVNSSVGPVADPDAKSKLANALSVITNLFPAITSVLQCS
jgi:hypothetical protein